MLETQTYINKYCLLHSMMTVIYNTIDNYNNENISLSIIINGDIYRSDDMLDYVDNTGLEHISSKFSNEKAYNLVIVRTVDELILIVNNA